MIYPDYIQGTSLVGYYNQMIAINAYPSRFLLSSKYKKYQSRRSPVYISPYLTETYTTSLAADLGCIIPESVLSEMRESAKAVTGPFDPAYASTFDALFEKELKYCPICIRNGEHYYSQQLICEDRCNKHGELLVKGCPICGETLSSTIEVSNIDALVCPSCYNKIADFPTAASLVSKLYDIYETENILVRKVVFNEKGYLVAMKGAENIFYRSDVVNILKKYLQSGHKPIRGITVKKGTKGRISLSERVFRYSGGELGRDSKRQQILEFVGKNETLGPKNRASAYLARTLIDNPKRLGIVPLKRVDAEIRRTLKDAGLADTGAITKAVITKYLYDMYEALVGVFEAHPYDSLLLLCNEGLIPEIRYAMIILEDEGNYYIYLFH